MCSAETFFTAKIFKAEVLNISLILVWPIIQFRMYSYLSVLHVDRFSNDVMHS